MIAPVGQLCLAVVSAIAVVVVLFAVISKIPSVREELENRFNFDLDAPGLHAAYLDLQILAQRARSWHDLDEPEAERDLKAQMRAAEKKIAELMVEHNKHAKIGRYDQGWARPPRSGARFAVIYHGAFFRTPDGLDGRVTWGHFPKCSDYFMARANHEDKLFGPLRSVSGAQVFTFLHTYTSGCPKRDDELVRALTPTMHEIVKRESRGRIVDGYLAGLKLLQRSQVQVDFVILTRFDLIFRVPFSSLNIDWQRINVPWRDIYTQWKSYKVTSDLLHVLPVHLVQPYADALEWSGTSAPAHMTIFKAVGSAHFIHPPLARDPRVGANQIHFVEKGYHHSRQDILRATDVTHDDLFVAILRSCPSPEPRCSRKSGNATYTRYTRCFWCK